MPVGYIPGHRRRRLRRDHRPGRGNGVGVGERQQREVTGTVACSVLVAREYGVAVQRYPGAHRVVVGRADGDGVHAGLHDRNAAAAVFVLDGWRAPATVVAHDDGDPMLPGRCCLNLPTDVHHAGCLVEIGMLDGVGYGLIDG